MRRERKPARPWQFWRRAFWTRPALLVVYGLACGAGGALMLSTLPGEIDDARSMASARECPVAAVRPNINVGAPSGCLERIEVVLDGPHYSRGPGSEWWLRVDGRIYDDVDLSTAASKRLRDGDTAGVLMWEGKPVVIEPSSGGRVETSEWGQAGWLIWLYLGMGLLGGLAFLIEIGRIKRVSAGGWWAMSDDKPSLADDSSGSSLSGLILIGCLLIAPAILGAFPIAIADSAPWSIVLAAAGVVLVVLAVILRRRRAGKKVSA